MQFRGNWGLTRTKPPLASTPCWPVFPGKIRPGSSARCASHAARRERVHKEFRVRWPDGSIHYLIVRGKALHDDSGARSG